MNNEPVAWMYDDLQKGQIKKAVSFKPPLFLDKKCLTPLYNIPQLRNLTEEEVWHEFYQASCNPIKFAQAILRKAQE